MEWVERQIGTFTAVLHELRDGSRRMGHPRTSHGANPSERDSELRSQFHSDLNLGVEGQFDGEWNLGLDISFTVIRIWGIYEEKRTLKKKSLGNTCVTSSMSATGC